MKLNQISTIELDIYQPENPNWNTIKAIVDIKYQYPAEIVSYRSRSFMQDL